MMRVVLDTNVFVSSFFGGNPRKIIDLWTRGRITLCVSRAILDEYIEVLRRMDLEKEPEFGELLNFLAQGTNILFTARTPTLHIVKSDPSDDKFIECAVALKAEYIVTGDKALVAVKNYAGIHILTPRQALDALT
jgi:uncharacterized protein